MRQPGKTRRRAVRLALSALALLLLAGFLWTQQNLIETEELSVTASGLPAAFDGYRIAVVSDVHGKEFGRDNRALLEQVDGLKPDLIALTGDVIDQADQLAMLPALAKGLSAIAPTYYVTGNHEWALRLVPEIEALLAENGVIVLNNRWVTLEAMNQHIFLMGADDPNGRADQKSVGQLAGELRQTGGEGFLLLLAHRNNRAEVYDAAGADLTLAGHAHGGLIRLPFTDGLVGPSRELFPTYTNGLYQLEHGQMVVSRGLGNVGRTRRLFNLPHLPLVVLHCAA